MYLLSLLILFIICLLGFKSTVFLILIGTFSKIFGNITEKYTKLPSLIGMMIFGMIIGPSFLNIVSNDILNISPIIKDISLISVLFIGGLGINKSQMKSIGKPAILLSIVPATLEGFTICFLSMIFLDFTFIQGAILGFIIAAVSPAVLVPSMIELIDKKLGQKKAIPQMLLVGASADDTVSITLFTTFLSLYKNSSNSIILEMALIPMSILFSLVVSVLIFKISKNILFKIKNENLKVIFIFLIIIFMRLIEKNIEIEIFNSLLSVMIFGYLIKNYTKDSEIIKENMNSFWNVGKLYLFSFVGMAINPKLIGQYLILGFIILTISLSVRSIGVLISLNSTNLNKKEKLFCVIAYLPKATVQSAKASVPIQNGVLGGEIMQAIAIFSVLFTAPLGSILIKLTSKKLLEKD